MTATVATAWVSPDEKAYRLTETWQRTPLGDRRVQRIQVLRDDRIAVYEQDVGPWDMEKDHPFYFPSMGEYSVAEVQEVAMQSREGRPLREPDDRLDILAAWQRNLDERRMRRDHRSSFGPFIRKVRA